MFKNLESVATAPQLPEEIRKTQVCVGGNGLSLAWLDRSPKFEIAAQGARIVRQAQCATIKTQMENLFGRNKQRPPMGLEVMQDGVDEPPVVRYPGCDQPMEAKDRTSLKK